MKLQFVHALNSMDPVWKTLHDTISYYIIINSADNKIPFRFCNF